ncbi:hypothetical protein BDV95DRAFT_596840 [Massariosphaeria phaeospora]|uniref:Uncharacterized protein n=1 Tax=Massariosphaeria phaeospora TaxID=100035 RepID=A0A7C8MBQ2_9PLEO|nr:hypothetical protein BDV95DRAFT_596840 [Massariosphaeria phaeospora]
MVMLDSTEASAAISGAVPLFQDVRDGRIGSSDQPPRPTFGLRVIKAYQSRIHHRQFLPGMQGLVLGARDDHRYVRVADLFNDNGQPLEDYIRRDHIEIGTKPYGTWQLQLRPIPRAITKLTPNELKLLDNPRYRHLALAISTFLQTLIEAQPDFVPPAIFAALGGERGTNIPWITSTIVQGVERAGLIRTMNNPHFTIKDLYDNATFDCYLQQGRDHGGFYFRRFTLPNPGQLKKHSRLYVGQAKNFENRALRYTLPYSGFHGEIIQQSDSIDMRALCLLDKVVYSELRYIVEQVFTSLLETYQSSLRERGIDVDDGQGSFHVRNCLELEQIAKEAAKMSGWTGAVRRRSFWDGQFASCDGVNYKSPVTESQQYGSVQWLRTDGFQPDPDAPSNAVPISNFLCARPRRATLVDYVDQQRNDCKVLVIFALGTGNKGSGTHFRMVKAFTDASGFDGISWPVEGTFYSVTFEVRRDWKPHPYSWARLPLLGPFEDWDRANSWALLIEWTDSTGQHRSRYHQCERTWNLLDYKSSGSMQGYARGIEMITIEASESETTIAPISSRRKHPDVIKSEMEGKGPNGDPRLTFVGLSMKEARGLLPKGQKVAQDRKKCDTCLFRGLSQNCVWNEDKGVCEYCSRAFGRPFCSFTFDIPAHAGPELRLTLMSRLQLLPCGRWKLEMTEEQATMAEEDENGWAGH